MNYYVEYLVDVIRGNFLNINCISTMKMIFILPYTWSIFYLKIVGSLIILTWPTQSNVQTRGKKRRSIHRHLIVLSAGMETALLGTSRGPGCKTAVLSSSLTDCGNFCKYNTWRRVSYFCCPFLTSGKCVPVTTAWRVLRLRLEERSPLWRVAANILNKQSGQPTWVGP
jgi:hypothetical protein